MILHGIERRNGLLNVLRGLEMEQVPDRFIKVSGILAHSLREVYKRDLSSRHNRLISSHLHAPSED